MVPLVLVGLLALQAPGNSGAEPFAQRVNEFEARAKQLAAAADDEARGRAALAWLNALNRLAKATPSRRRTPAQNRWLAAHPSLMVYNEPGGQWMIPLDVIWQTHAQHANTGSAEAIAWMAVTNGLGGECEGYVPCYASRLNVLNGEYLRRHPSGAHVDEALQGIQYMFGRSSMASWQSRLPATFSISQRTALLYKPRCNRFGPPSRQPTPALSQPH